MGFEVAGVVVFDKIFPAMRQLLGILVLSAASVGLAESLLLSPTALVAPADGKEVYVACATGKRVLFVNTNSRKVIASIPTPEPPSGLAPSGDNKLLFVTCAAPESKACVVGVTKQQIVGTIPVGHTARAPVISPDGKTLFVCNQFNNNVSVIDLVARTLLHCAEERKTK